MTQVDAIVIGSGIIGCCVGYELAKKGYQTLNVDKLPAAGYGSTSSSCAVIRLHYSTLDGTLLAYESSFYWEDWEGHVGTGDESGLARYTPTGCLVLRSPDVDWAVLKAYLEAVGEAYAEWDENALKDRLPLLDTHSFWPVRRPEDPEFGTRSSESLQGALFYRRAGYVAPPNLAAHNVQIAAQELGSKFQFNRRVVDILKENEKVRGVVLDDGQKLQAPIVVNAAGPHSSIVNRLAGVDRGMTIRTRALRREVAQVPMPPGFELEGHGLVGADGDVGVYFRPELGSHLLVGSLDPECDPLDWVDDPDEFYKGHTDQWTAQVYRMALRIPTLPIPNQMRGVVDLYDASSDWIPVYDRSDLQGFYMAVGTSGNQFKNAPAVGALMAELIDQCEKGRDHDHDPIQYQLKHIDRTINLGFYSRKRILNPESSFSVVG